MRGELEVAGAGADGEFGVETYEETPESECEGPLETFGEADRVLLEELSLASRFDGFFGEAGEVEPAAGVAVDAAGGGGGLCRGGHRPAESGRKNRRQCPWPVASPPTASSGCPGAIAAEGWPAGGGLRCLTLCAGYPVAATHQRHGRPPRTRATRPAAPWVGPASCP